MTTWRVHLYAKCCAALADGPHKGLCQYGYRGAVQLEECERWLDDGPLGQWNLFLRPAAGRIRITWAGPAVPGRAREGHHRGRMVRVSAGRRAGRWWVWVRLAGHPLYAGPTPATSLPTAHAWGESLVCDALLAMGPRR